MKYRGSDLKIGYSYLAQSSLHTNYLIALIRVCQVILYNANKERLRGNIETLSSLVCILTHHLSLK